MQNSLKEAKDEDEIKLIMELNAEKLNGMKEGDERDELALESIDNVMKLALERVRKVIDVEDESYLDEGFNNAMQRD